MFVPSQLGGGRGWDRTYLMPGDRAPLSPWVHELAPSPRSRRVHRRSTDASGCVAPPPALSVDLAGRHPSCFTVLFSSCSPLKSSSGSPKKRGYLRESFGFRDWTPCGSSGGAPRDFGDLTNTVLLREISAKVSGVDSPELLTAPLATFRGRVDGEPAS